jgi:hypothetical protein
MPAYPAGLRLEASNAWGFIHSFAVIDIAGVRFAPLRCPMARHCRENSHNTC